jgi:hypothetical protein
MTKSPLSQIKGVSPAGNKNSDIELSRRIQEFIF